MHINHIKSKIHFGKYKGDTFENIVMTDPEYISWCIKNLDSFFLGMDFIKNAIMINKDFTINDVVMPLFKSKMEKTFEAVREAWFERLDDYEEHEIITNDYLYLKWLDKGLQPELIKKEMEFREEELTKMSVETCYGTVIEDSTDYSNYNENLGWGEQSEDFWNQF